jgi:transposase-like protein
MQDQGDDEKWLARLREQKRWSRSDGQRVLDLCRLGGESKSAFARRHHLPEHRVHYWAVWERDHGQDARVAGPVVTTTLVPVAIRQAKSRDEGHRVAMRICAGTLEVLDAAQVDPTWLAALLGALRAGVQ